MKQEKPKQGSILISEPFLHDPFFKRSVVLVVEKNPEGSLGFILNKPTGIMINDALHDFPPFQKELFFGGPVNKEALYYLHTLGEKLPDSIEVLPGLYWGGSFEALQYMIQSGEVPENEIRFFVGYSGWGPTQMEEEIERNGWLVAQGSKEHVLTPDPDLLWQDTLKSMGSRYAVLANFPEDPSLN